MDRRDYPRLWIQELENMKPLIQIDDEIREMTDEEYSELIASGWTSDGETETTEE